MKNTLSPSTFKTQQEKFWAGEFGNEYILRNKNAALVTGAERIFKRIFSKTTKIDSLVEFGANIGNNLSAISRIKPKADLSAVEINAQAVEHLKKIGNIEIYHASLHSVKLPRQYDFVFTKGVLIHINPRLLASTYKMLYESSRKYVCVIEYFNPRPVEVTYRGHAGRLFKRDFAGEMLDTFKDLKLIDYGFIYSRDAYYLGCDNLTWFLMKKKEQ